MNADTGRTSFGRRVGTLAKEHPDSTALLFAQEGQQDQRWSWRDLDADTNRAAQLLASRGVARGSCIVVALPNSPEHVVFTIGAWKLGACVLPLQATLPPAERLRLLGLVTPALVVGDWTDTHTPQLSLYEARRLEAVSDAPLPDCIPCPGKAIASGGSTGRPKIIVDPQPWAKRPGECPFDMARLLGVRHGQVQLVAGPLYHNAPFYWAHYGLFEDHTLVVMPKFDAAHATDLIERHRVNWMFLAPTMMRRILRVPGIKSRDLSSLQAVYHAGAPTPDWLREAWFDLIGAERMHEAFGSTEAVGFVSIRGDEWLQHRGSVGRPRHTELRILDEHGSPVGPGVTGEIFMRPADRAQPTYTYIGAPPAVTALDGLTSVGDLGWLDDDGYLHIADRRADLILSGGANIYPAEVEAALSAHPLVADIAVIGLPDDDWGQRVHAIVQTVDASAPPSTAELDAYCRARLAAYKRPKSYEFVDRVLRNESGKLRRSDLAAERRGDAAALGQR